MKKYMEYEGGLYVGRNIIVSPTIYATELPWDKAKQYCEKLIIDGYKGWRMPSRKELYFINDSLKFICYEKYKFYLPYYWSSEEESQYYAWVENMKGFGQSCYKEYVHGVRPIKVAGIYEQR
jgi:hypothetical protein